MTGKLLSVIACAAAFAGFATVAVAAPQLATPPVIVPAAAASAQVPVAQQPLTTRQPIPPNIVLMLDDSGSMRFSVMPDYQYLSDKSAAGLVNSTINGVYFNPDVTYTPPPDTTGTLYPASAFTAAPVDGFDSGSATVDLSTYRGVYDTYDVSYIGTPVAYSISVAKSGATSYAPAADCPADSDASGGAHPGYCYFTSKSHVPSVPYNFYDASNSYFYVSRCNSVSDVYDHATDTCTPGISFFTYTTGTPGDYTRHYVAANSTNCDDVDLPAGTCDESDAARQNVANWFTYYHTRILLAKSGLMRAFDGMNPLYRLGFGSINNDNKSFIEGLKDSDGNAAYTTKSSVYIADVSPFGDGGSGTQRANFWQWVSTITPNSSTPLRKALKAVGQYYEDKAPWKSVNATTGDDEYLACRQSYVILTTDGFWNGGTPDVGNTDGNNGDTVTGPNGNSYKYTPYDPLKDSRSDTLSDVAMKYWETDLRSDISNELPTSTADPAFWQHMVTFTIGMGFTPSDKAGNEIDKDAVSALFQWSQTGTRPASLGGWGGWPNPSSDSINNIADLVHAGLNGHGGFYSATDPDSFIDGLKNALKRAQQRTGTGASLAANSTKLETGTVTYQAFYHTSIWTGELKAFAIDPAGAISTTPSWNAAVEVPAPSDRNIYTYAPGSATWSAGSGTYFALKNASGAPPSDLTSEQQKALSGFGSAPAVASSSAEVQIIDYLRGDESQTQLHGGIYRTRVNASGNGENVLGDIVDSQPVYVGAPEADTFAGETFSGSSDYPAFASSSAGRTALIYVAANDGMLHAFNASTGAEAYAFLPADVITHGGVDSSGNVIGVSVLANPDYGSLDYPHQYFNDGQLTVASAYFDSAWHSVLVGTTGRGLAKTIYALDVTNPASIKFLWERSAWDGGTNSGYIGQMTGKPVIAQVADGKWAVLIGNGYNSANGQAALLQFKLSDGTLSVHATTDTTTGNGLAPPAVWIGDVANGVSTIAYAGDLHGQVWSFQLSKVVTDPATHVTTVTATPTSAGTKLFTAKDAGGKAQPITAGMLAGRDPDTGNLWVFFGTGRYLSADDLNDTSVQTWYGLIVQSSTVGLAVASTSTRANLAQRNIIAQTAGSSTVNPDGTITVVLPARVVSPPDDPDTASLAGKSGWYMDLETPGLDADGNATNYESPVAAGERMVVPNSFHSGRLIGTTQIPSAGDPCNPSGTGWIMALDPFTGTNPRPQFFDINGDGVINNADMIPVDGKLYPTAGLGFTSLPNAPNFVTNQAGGGGSGSGGAGAGEPGPGEICGRSGGSTMLVSLANGTTASFLISGQGCTFTRVSWREMVNP